ncbi:hypothetical protein [Nocardioides sp. GXZ039]|uniref:hypothetical protein n=1 Tax=Nocardioides sp. GXZ039 TaxID=3136018 RepID=UPI0030F3B9CA
MESNDLGDQLSTVERAEAAPYLDTPKTPWWYLVGAPVWAGAYVANFAWFETHQLLFCLVTIGLLALAGLSVKVVGRRHGAMPRIGHGNPPPEIARSYRHYLIGLAVVVIVAITLCLLIPIPIAALVTAVLALVGILAYERVHATAVAQVRARLS